MARLGYIGDIVPAQLQDAPDYSPSAPLFLSTLYWLSGGASYYNPLQAAQGNIIPAGVTALDTGGDGGTQSSSPTPAQSSVPMPSATTGTMPSIVSTAQTVSPIPAVTIPSLAQRMPSIVDDRPSVVPSPCAGSFSQWVSDNPLLALGGLSLLAWAVLGRGR